MGKSSFFAYRNNCLNFLSLNYRLRYNTCSSYWNCYILSRRSNKGWKGLGLDNTCCEKWDCIRLSYCLNWTVWVIRAFVVAAGNALIVTIFHLTTFGKINHGGNGTILPAFIGFISNVLERSSSAYLHIPINWGNSFPHFFIVFNIVVYIYDECLINFNNSGSMIFKF